MSDGGANPGFACLGEVWRALRRARYCSVYKLKPGRDAKKIIHLPLPLSSDEIELYRFILVLREKQREFARQHVSFGDGLATISR